MRHRPLSTQQHSDPETEEHLRDIRRGVTNLQSDANDRASVIIPVTLPDATRVIVPHKLGRAPKWVGPSIPRGAASSGYVNEVPDAAIDRTKTIVVQADGYGATITMNLLVM